MAATKLNNCGERRLITTFFAVVLLVTVANAVLAEERLLSIDDAISIALEQGYEMKSIRLNLISAEQNRTAASHRFLTNATATFNAPIWSEQVTAIQVPNALPVYNSVGSLRYQGQFDISQPLPTDGKLTLRSRLYQSQESNYFADTDKELKRKDFLTSISLNLSQPLFTYNRLKTSLERAELNYENSMLSLNRTQLDVVYTVTQSFFGLYRQSRTHEINRETLDQKEKAYELARLKFEAGLIPEVEALQMQVDLADARAGFFSSAAALERQKDDFKQTLGLTLSDSVAVKTEISYTHFDIDLAKAIEYGMKNRTELREGEIQIRLQEMSVIETDARTEINANLTAYYDFTGRSDTALPYDTGVSDLFNSSWDDLERRPGNRGVTFLVNLPVWDWGVNKAEVASAQASLRRAQLSLEDQRETVESSIRNSVRSVQEAEQRLEVLKIGQEVAQQTYDISLERFGNGEITSQDLALDSNRLSSSKLSYLNAYITYQLSVADLKRKTLYDFEKSTPLIQQQRQ